MKKLISKPITAATSKSDLDWYCKNINAELGLDDSNGFHIDYAYGGARLVKQEGAGIRDISPRMTKPQLADALSTVEAVLRYAKK
jgi:hypothetical protein